MDQASVNICYFAFNSKPTSSDIERISAQGEKIIIFDSAVAVSEFHVRAALKEANNTYAQVKKYRRIGALFLMYLTGCDQIEDALRKARITADTKVFISLILDEQKCRDALELFPENVVLTKPSIPSDNPDEDRRIFNAMTLVSLKL